MSIYITEYVVNTMLMGKYTYAGAKRPNMGQIQGIDNKEIINT